MRILLLCLVAACATAPPIQKTPAPCADGPGEVTVLGHVISPSTIPYRRCMTAAHAVARAGGFDELASARKTTLIRRVAGQTTRVVLGEGGLDTPLVPGDIVFSRALCDGY